jgi:hypothetical protein
MSVVPVMRRTRNYPFANDKLRVAVNYTRHEARWDERVREKRCERECCETLPDRPTKKSCPIAAHARRLCAMQPAGGKRGKHGRPSLTPGIVRSTPTRP